MYETKFSNFILTTCFLTYLGEKVNKGQNGDIGYSDMSRYSDKKESGTVAKRKGETACSFYEQLSLNYES